MRREFIFKVKEDYGYNGPIFYVTNEVQNPPPDLNKVAMWGTYESRVNGPNTAYATFYYEIRWPMDPDQWFGFTLNKHFVGDNAGQKARRWLNYLLENSPDYVKFF